MLLLWLCKYQPCENLALFGEMFRAGGTINTHSGACIGGLTLKAAARRNEAKSKAKSNAQLLRATMQPRFPCPPSHSLSLSFPSAYTGRSLSLPPVSRALSPLRTHSLQVLEPNDSEPSQRLLQPKPRMQTSSAASKA